MFGACAPTGMCIEIIFLTSTPKAGVEPARQLNGPCFPVLASSPEIRFLARISRQVNQAIDSILGTSRNPELHRDLVVTGHFSWLLEDYGNTYYFTTLLLSMRADGIEPSMPPCDIRCLPTGFEYRLK